MKVLVFALAPLWSPHFETELELIAKHESQGDDVVLVRCSGALQSCLANPYHRELDCIACRSKCSKGLTAIDRPAWNSELIGAPTDEMERAIGATRFDSVSDLRAFRYDEIAIGRGAASSLISILRDSDPDMESHQELTRRLLVSAFQTVRAVRAAIESHHPDLVYVFNGRFATSLPVLEVCKQHGVKVMAHDASYALGKYRLVMAGTVHDLGSLKQRVVELWTDAEKNDPEREEKAREFYEHRRYGGDASGHHHLDFRRSQRPGEINALIPGEFVAILNSSEDEFATLSQYANPVYRDQMEGLETIIGEPRLSGTHLVVRVHPNLRGLANEQTARIAAIRSRDNVTVIPADDPVDTYALIENAACVVTFGSRAGIEAVYWGTPSILAGRALHEDLGVQRASSHTEVVEAILNPGAPSDVEGALQYGYFQRESGIKFERYEQEDYFTGRINGRRIRPSMPIRTLRRGRNLFRLATSVLRKSRSENRKIAQR